MSPSGNLSLWKDTPSKALKIFFFLLEKPAAALQTLQGNVRFTWYSSPLNSDHKLLTPGRILWPGTFMAQEKKVRFRLKS